MKWLPLALIVFALQIVQFKAEEQKEEGWKDLLEKTLKHVDFTPFADGTFADGTLDERMLHIQDLIRNEYGRTIPVFVPPHPQADPKAKPVSKEDNITRIGGNMYRVPIRDVFRYVSSLSQCEVIVTDVGLVIRPRI